VSVQRPTRPPRDPDLAASQKNLLTGRRVARLVHGREPVAYDELVEIVAASLGLTLGAAEAAVRRAADAGHVELWVMPASGRSGEPDVERVLGALEGDAQVLQEARRRARAEGEG